MEIAKPSGFEIQGDTIIYSGLDEISRIRWATHPNATGIQNNGNVNYFEWMRYEFSKCSYCGVLQGRQGDGTCQHCGAVLPYPYTLTTP